MKRTMGRRTIMGLLAMVFALGTASVYAQPGGGGRGGRGQGGPGGGNEADREARMREWQQRRTQEMKETLKVSDEEWKAIEPLYTAVEEKRRETMRGMFGGFGRGRGGPGGDQAQQDESPMGKLRKLLEDENSKSADIKDALKAVRDEREKGETELKAARDKLRQVLTVRQEAVFVTRGILD